MYNFNPIFVSLSFSQGVFGKSFHKPRIDKPYEQKSSCKSPNPSTGNRPTFQTSSILAFCVIAVFLEKHVFLAN